MGFNLITLSDQDEDQLYFSEMAKKENWSFKACLTLGDLESADIDETHSIILLDADHPKAQLPDCPYPMSKVRQYLNPLFPATKVFPITSQPINRNRALIDEGNTFKYPFYHNIIRNYDESSKQILPKIIGCTQIKLPNGLHSFFNEKDIVEEMKLTESTQREKTVLTVEKKLQAIGMDSRLSARVAQASDELLMNAIFDAPRDKSGNPSRMLMDRRAQFKFGAAETVDLQIGIHDNYIGVCVSDHYGSINGDTLRKYLEQSYREDDYKVNRYKGQSAGLGLYGIIHAGLSIVLISDHKKQTHAMIFCPRTDSYRSFRRSFQFSACFF